MFIGGVVKDAFGLWLNQHTDEALQIAEMCINNAQSRMREGKKVARKKITAGPALPGKLADCTVQDVELGEIFPEGDSAGAPLSRQGTGVIAGGHAAKWERSQYLEVDFRRYSSLAGSVRALLSLWEWTSSSDLFVFVTQGLHPC